MKILIKYGTVVLLFLLLINYTHTYFDFTASKSNIFVLPLIAGLLVINFVIIYALESKHITTNWVFTILILLFGVNLYLNTTQSNKEIWHEYYISPDPQLKTRGYELKLYADKTYMLNEYWHGESKHYFGAYEFENDILTLGDKTIEDKTESQMTSEYKYNNATKLFESIENGYPNLKVRNE
ncbi:hypothetical protein LF887_08755 [Chryseobacterium sp. MEBOG06]|uniref:hypothetical protein n=1 Tax=Chryseobacterium sp. MEBOG06 TaxID=2879938 RepID=UPI001F2B709C|nr:hypothetical protein [Chryseobacterium sp. MEBOG06]UKB85697.1 hypothetical protein LF887_08755 [Chryseobacterium sp. MEBOG06]